MQFRFDSAEYLVCCFERIIFGASSHSQVLHDGRISADADGGGGGGGSELDVANRSTAKHTRHATRSVYRCVFNV